MMAGLMRIIGGGALVTACTVVTKITLGSNDVGFSKAVTLSWSGAAGGAGNPITKYEIYRAETIDGDYQKIAEATG